MLNSIVRIGWKECQIERADQKSGNIWCELVRNADRADASTDGVLDQIRLQSPPITFQHSNPEKKLSRYNTIVTRIGLPVHSFPLSQPLRGEASPNMLANSLTFLINTLTPAATLLNLPGTFARNGFAGLLAPPLRCLQHPTRLNWPDSGAGIKGHATGARKRRSP